jgi:hypothetical protein
VGLALYARLPKIDLLEFEISTSNYCLAYYREVYLAKGVPEDWILVEILSPSIGHFHSDHESSQRKVSNF